MELEQALLGLLVTLVTEALALMVMTTPLVVVVDQVEALAIIYTPGLVMAVMEEILEEGAQVAVVIPQALQLATR